MDHFPFAPLSSLGTWIRHALEIPREMQPDWGIDPPLTLDKEEASMLGFRVSVTPSPPRKKPHEKAKDIAGAVERCERRNQRDDGSMDTSSPEAELPQPGSSPSFSKLYRQQEGQQDDSDGPSLRCRRGNAYKDRDHSPLRHRADSSWRNRSLSRGGSAIAALAEYGSSPPLTPAAKRGTLTSTAMALPPLNSPRATFGERLARLPFGTICVNTLESQVDPSTSSKAAVTTKPPAVGKKRRKKAPRKPRKRTRGGRAPATSSIRSAAPLSRTSSTPHSSTEIRGSATLSLTAAQSQNVARPQLASSPRVPDNAAGLDLLALAAATTSTDEDLLHQFIMIEEESQDGLLGCEVWEEGAGSLAHVHGSASQRTHRSPGLLVEVEDEAAVGDDMRISLHALGSTPAAGAMEELLDDVEAGLDATATIQAEEADVIHVGTAESPEAMFSQNHDQTPLWSLSQPPSAIFGTDKILPVPTTSIPSSDTFEPTSELDIDSTASTPLNLRRIFTGQVPRRLMGSRSSEANAPLYSAPNSPTPTGKRFTGGKRPLSPDIPNDEDASIITPDRPAISVMGSATVKRWKHGRPVDKSAIKIVASPGTDEFARSIAERAKRTRSQVATPVTPANRQVISKLRLSSKTSTSSAPIKTPSSPLKKTQSGSSSGTCFEPATPDGESSAGSDFEPSFKPSNRSFKTPKYPRKSYSPAELDIIAKHWQGGTDPIRLEILDKICAELKQNGFKRTRDALKTHMGTNLRTAFAQRFRKNFTHTTRGIPVRSCSFDT